MVLGLPNLNRRGVSLTEILIGIMVLGIGVITLATLFPLGLLKMRRAVNDVRGKVLAENAWNEVRARNLLAAPYGPPAAYFSRYPYVQGTTWPLSAGNAWWFPITPSQGTGLPVIIDPFYILENVRPDRYRFGHVDFDNDANGLPDGTAPFGEGILRLPGCFLPGADLRPGRANVDDDGNGITDGIDRDGNGTIDPWEFDTG